MAFLISRIKEEKYLIRKALAIDIRKEKATKR